MLAQVAQFAPANDSVWWHLGPLLVATLVLAGTWRRYGRRP